MSNVSSLNARTAREKRTPHIKLTRYDVTVSALSTAVIFAVLTLIVSICLCFSRFAPPPIARPIPLIQAANEGFESDGPISQQDVESPEDVNRDSSLANEETSVTELEEVAEQVVEISRYAATIVVPDAISDTRSSNSAGSADGTGTSRLGLGEDRVHGGQKPEHLWIVEFADKGDLKNYEMETQMKKIEQEFGGHISGEIRRTYFRVRKAENGYEFFVQKQLLK